MLTACKNCGAEPIHNKTHSLCRPCYWKHWRSKNPGKTREYYNRWKARNLQHARQLRKESNQHNRTHILTRDREHYRANREQCLSRREQWGKTNPLRVLELRAIRRARKRAAFVENVNYESIYVRDRGLCGICGRIVSATKFEIDHITPISRGGTHEPANVQVAHPRCNKIKGASIGGKM